MSSVQKMRHGTTAQTFHGSDTNHIKFVMFLVVRIRRTKSLDL